MAIIKNNLKIKNSNGSEDLLYPQTSWDKVEDLSAHTVDLTTNQVIDGQKDFEITPRVKINYEVHNLPSEYQEVMYLESTGTQYINTGVVLTNLHSVEIDYQLTSTQQTNRRGLYGILSTNAASRFGSLFSPTNYYLEHGYGVTNIYWQQGLPDTNRHVLKQDKNVTYMDGAAIHTFNEATFTTTGNALLGNFNYTNYIPALAKYYESKWWNNGVLIRDFIPCYRKSDDKPGYYDIVNDVFYINAGTSDFILGPDVEPVTYEAVLTNASFSTVATTGNYNDLINKPTIPTATNQLTNNSGFVTNSILAPYTMTSAVVQSDGLLSFSFSGSVFSSTYNKWLGTFTMGNCFFMIPLYNLTQNTLYKTSGTFVYNSSGAVVTTTINYKVTSNNTLLVWSGNSEKTLASGYTAYISLLRLF